jgi:hypothetical protein
MNFFKHKNPVLNNWIFMCNLRVAEFGFAPKFQGYEPCELLLLYPAVLSRNDLQRKSFSRGDFIL